MAWFSDCEAAFTSSNEVTYKRFSSTFAMLRTGPPTMYLHMILRSRLAAGHSGQNNTHNKSEIKLSKIARYSASLEFFVDFVFPDLQTGQTGKSPVCEVLDLCVKNKTMVFAALVAESSPDTNERNS